MRGYVLGNLCGLLHVPINVRRAPHITTVCTMTTPQLCIYGPHCRISEGLLLPTEECGASSRGQYLHHLYQGEFESAFEHVIDTVETTGKRCLVCLLSENNCVTDDVCKATGGIIYNNEDIEVQGSFRIEPSPGNGGSVKSSRTPHPGNTMLRVEGEETEKEAHEEEEDQEEHDDQDEGEEREEPDNNGAAPSESRKKNRGGIKGEKRLPMQRTALTLQQQVLLLQHHEHQSKSGTKPSYVSLQE